MELINAYVEASDGGAGDENAVWHHDYNQYDEIVYDYQALGKKIVELLSTHSSLQLWKRRSLPPSYQVREKRRGEWQSNSFKERLACEIDQNLFVALIEQYAEGDCKIREQPVARWERGREVSCSDFYDSMGRFCELLYQAFVDPMNTRAPPVLNMVFSNFSGGL